VVTRFLAVVDARHGGAAAWFTAAGAPSGSVGIWRALFVEPSA
jgi:hypothetical protein